MKKWFKYALEALQVGGVKLLWVSIEYFLLKKVPSKDLVIDNPEMGKFLCRANTLDFMFSFKSYEYKVKKAIWDRLSEYDVYIDIGACIGDYSIWMAKNGLQAYAFEPNGDNHTSLMHNVALNGLEQQVVVSQFGLGKVAETVEFQSHPTNRGYTGKYASFEGGLKETVIIKQFDQAFQDLGIGFDQSMIIKIDAEGMEPEIIEGAREVLQKIKKVFLIFEAHTGADKTLENLREIVDFELVQLDELNIGVIIQN